MRLEVIPVNIEQLFKQSDELGEAIVALDELQHNSENGSETPNKHLKLAFTHCCDSWFPANPELLEKIRGGLKEGRYESDRDELIKELKSDFSLFAYSVKELAKLSQTQNGQAAAEIDPCELLRTAKLSDLRKIIVDGGNLSSHDLSKMNYVQTRRLLHSMLSASTAELLAEKYEIPVEAAFSCALFRQLGLTLIAFNYPHVYERISLSLKPGETIDEMLNKMLGFSPSMLGLTMAKEWNLTPEIRVGMGDETVDLTASSKAAQIRSTAQALDKVCKVGEALARASDPEHYPSASSDWEMARREIESTLGPKGFKLLKDALRDNCESYIAIFPDLFKFPETIEPGKDFQSTQIAESTRQNQYIRRCPPILQKYLKDLYLRLDQKTLTRDNIDFLVKEVIPLAGFKQGCIYLVDPEMRNLMPRLAIGSAPITRYRAIKSSASSSPSDPILSAYRSGAPIMETNVETDVGQVSYVAGVIGNLQKAGVLYLELTEELIDDKNGSPVLYFKAIRQALNDCLNLN